MNKILITGANGFIGRNTASYFSKQGYQVHGIGLGKWKQGELSQYGIDFWQETPITIEALQSLSTQYDSIIHCAGNGSVGNSLLNPYDDFQQNVEIVAYLLEYMRLYNHQAKLVILSSAAVYGLKELRPITENDELCPISPYGYHKKIAEELCENYHKNFNLNIAVLRLFSVFGNGLCKQLLWDSCCKFEKTKSQEVEFFGIGDEVRDWIPIDEVVRLIELVSLNNSSFSIYNGGTGIKTSNKEILELLSENYDKNLKIVFNNQTKLGDPKYYWADITKLKSLGFDPKIDLKGLITNYIKWFKAQL